MKTSTTAAPHHAGHRFRNIEPATPVGARAALTVAKDMTTRNGAGRPPAPVPVERPDFPHDPAPLAATWLGHATVLIEIDGHCILADPIESFRCSPVAFTGPARMHRAPIATADLPHLDAIVISHDHYDHLDKATIAALVITTAAPICVPLGIGSILRSWGVPPQRVVELDWHEQRRIGDLAVTCTPARHFSGRGLTRNSTLWSSWAIQGPEHRAFFGGDTGYTAAFTEIADRYGPFDLTMLPIGAYDDAWPDVHMNPEQAATAHKDLRGATLLPIHWATFDLARHRYADPIERLLVATDPAHVLTPPPGRRLTLGRNAPQVATDPWWRAAS